MEEDKCELWKYLFNQSVECEQKDLDAAWRDATPTVLAFLSTKYGKVGYDVYMRHKRYTYEYLGECSREILESIIEWSEHA